MKKFILEQRVYRMFDYLRLSVRIAPVAIAVIIFTGITLALVPTAIALTTSRFVDTASAVFQGTLPRDAIRGPLFACLGVFSVFWVFGWMTDYAWTHFRMRVTEDFMPALLEKKAKLAYAHIENAETWDLIRRVAGSESGAGQNQYEPVNKIFGGYGTIHTLGIAVVRIVGLLSVFFIHVWWSGFVVILLSIPLFVVSLKNGRMNYKAKKSVQSEMRQAEYFNEILTDRTHVEEREMFGYHGEIQAKWKHKFEIARKTEAAAQWKSFFRSNISSVCASVIWFIIALALLPSVSGGRISLGVYIALIGSVVDIVQQMTGRLAYGAEVLAEHREYLKDLTEFMALSETPDATCKPSRTPPEIRELCFENVRFRYPGGENYILDGVNFTMKAGTRYAFVGANGAGKTTIIKLLTGLYPEYEGRILINGRELREYAQAELKALCAIVHQDFARYSVSIHDNIALGNSGALEDGTAEGRIRDAVEMTRLDGELARLPEGIMTKLGRIYSGSHDLSGGQWQRVAITRAMVSDASLVILDEPTAALDPVAESNLYTEFSRISRSKTSIFISHRLGSIKLADFIFVLDSGKVSEEGSHEALMARGGQYASMYDAQKEWYQ